MPKYNRKIIVALLTSLAVVACSSNVPAPVVDLTISKSVKYSHAGKQNSRFSRRNRFQTPSQTSSHKVKAGETLFSIAWRYSLDFNELAKINNIKQNKIFPGQTLSLISTEFAEENLEIFNPHSLITALN